MNPKYHVLGPQDAVLSPQDCILCPRTLSCVPITPSLVWSKEHRRFAVMLAATHPEIPAMTFSCHVPCKALLIGRLDEMYGRPCCTNTCQRDEAVLRARTVAMGSQLLSLAKVHGWPGQPGRPTGAVGTGMHTTIRKGDCKKSARATTRHGDCNKTFKSGSA